MLPEGTSPALPTAGSDPLARSTSWSRRYLRLKAFLDEALAPERRDDSLALGLCFALIGVGIFWRFRDLAYPPYFMFDEHHFVSNARNYVRHIADWNDHPPFGKLLIVPGLVFFGDNGFGWRVHAAILGSIHLALVHQLAKHVFADQRVGVVAATFVAIDGIFVSYSRVALLDIPMNVFMLAALVMILKAESKSWLAGAAVFIGLGVAVKWIAICVAPLVPLLLWRKARSRWLVAAYSLWMGAIVVTVYAAIWWLALEMTHQPFSVESMVRKNLELLKNHTGFTDWQHPADSRWYTWPILWKPVLLHRADIPDGYRRVASTVGNPVIWFATTAAFALSAFEIARSLWERLARRTVRMTPVRAQALLLFAAGIFILQWIVTNRESYIWHYMATYTMGIILLAERVVRLWDKDPLKVVLVLLPVGAISIFYAPIWTNDPLATAVIRSRLFMPLWR